MTQKTKELIIKQVWWTVSFMILFGVYTYLLYSFGFNMKHSSILALVLTVPTSYLSDICGYLRNIIEQRKELVDGLSKIADRLNESKEVDRQLCDELHRQNERDSLNDARKALNS